MTVIAKGNGKAKTVAQQGCQRNDSLPRHVGSILHTSSLEVRTRTANTNRTYGLIPAIILSQEHYALGKLAYKRTDSCVFISGKAIFGNNLSPQINYRISGLFQTDINAYNAFFHFSCVHRTSTLVITNAKVQFL